MSNTFDPTNFDKVFSIAGAEPTAYRSVFMQITVENQAGSGAGAAVATPVTFDPPLPAGTYNAQVVAVVPNQDAVFYVGNVDSAGFTLTLNPRLAANTLAGGFSSVLLKWDL